MTDEDVERRARELQAEPDPKKLFTQPPWENLTDQAREYWRQKARAEPKSLRP
jgi:hypothetical protein